MVYRINLYPAGIEKKAARSGAIRRSAALTLVAGIQVVFLGLFVLSALTLREQADAAEKTISSNQEKLKAEMMTEGRGTINTARVILERKIQRQNWTPVMSEVGNLLPDALILDKIEATGSGPAGSERFSGMTLSGRLRTGSSIDPVVAFARKLSNSELYREQFSDARVDRMDTSGEGAKFAILCPLKSIAAETPEDGGD